MEKSRSALLNTPAATPDAPGAAQATARRTRASSLVDRLLGRKLLEMLGRPPIAMRLWDDEHIRLADLPDAACLVVRDRAALYRLARYPDLHFGDLYSAGRVEVEGNLVAFLETVYQGIARHFRASAIGRLHDRLLNRPRPNSLEGSRENIHHHYDIGNDFYRLWLDSAAMQYTCAYFPDPAMTLEQAQLAKLDHVARKLRLQPGDRVVEAGCGWGGLARYFARHYGVKVRAFNISREQVDYARAQAHAEGLARRVEYVLDDYRNIDGEYDAFVSIGMLEHVGPDHYPELGDIVDRCLAPHGRGLIHTIGRNRPGKMNPWIEQRIFPGARPPALSEMMAIFEPRDFSVLDVENLRLHYAKTLEHWLARFDAHETDVAQMFDQAFVRAWRLYLAGSIAAFTTGSLQLFQVAFVRGTNNDLPWSRAALYRD